MNKIIFWNYVNSYYSVLEALGSNTISLFPSAGFGCEAAFCFNPAAGEKYAANQRAGKGEGDKTEDPVSLQLIPCDHKAEGQGSYDNGKSRNDCC